MGDFVPAPGTRVTVDDRVYEYFDGLPFTRWATLGNRVYVNSDHGKALTRIAELEAKVAELEGELTELRPLARAANDIANDHEKALARLARYAALGKEAAEEESLPYSHTDASLVNEVRSGNTWRGRLAALWRAPQEGR